MTVRVGDLCVFWANTPSTDETPDVQAEAARVIFVQPNNRVNLEVVAHMGARRIVQNVRFYDTGSATQERPSSNFAEWSQPR